ncbi:hypothetical protein Mlab_0471 [Methanocorpusculum labreanum Z]|uniref:Uncharacterized protein n=1 Tax=Methanocorpusculum labreanum (strain ATCC 43576 / DSM 4855 / Z) TaxID=410358 RepID=A2SQN9_METLZ|nr:hypothetical protein [Methanocorpusculum labreanum]ABN06645.1 hypothetical protein Mlab_0471 [Methanocorpusculum labreanum Z]
MSDVEEKRIHLIWASVILMLGISILVTYLVPAVGFWEGTGIFLTGVGVISCCLAMFMGQRRSPVFPLLMILAGVLLLVQGLLTTIFPVISTPVLIGAALVIVAAGAIIFLILKK